MSSEMAEVQRQLSSLRAEEEKLLEELRLLPSRTMHMMAREARGKAIGERLAVIDRDLARLVVSEGRLHDEELASSNASLSASEQAKREDRSFWFRRFAQIARGLSKSWRVMAALHRALHSQGIWNSPAQSPALASRARASSARYSPPEYRA